MSGRPPRDRWYLGGLLLCIVLGLAATAYGVFSPSLRKLYARNIDSVEIATCAEGATSADIAGWWTGVWIQPTSPYYRPLSSMLFWLEYKAFGMNFQGHVLVSWVLHAVLCALLYRLAFRLLPGPPRERVCFAVVAVVLFNLRRGPTGPDWIAAPVAHGVVAWWPGQTDQFCLLCCLPALSLLDRWWLEGGRRDLAWGGVLTAVALLFKEMAVTMPLLVDWFGWLSARLRHVRILNGDWTRACTTGASLTLPVRQGHGPAGVFLDPPYADTASRVDGLYAHDSLVVAHDVREWCLANGDDPRYRIILAGFEDEHDIGGTDALVDAGWTSHEWFTAGFLSGGMGNTGKDGHQQKRERIWSSPHCVTPSTTTQLGMFGE